MLIMRRKMKKKISYAPYVLPYIIPPSLILFAVTISVFGKRYLK